MVRLLEMRREARALPEASSVLRAVNPGPYPAKSAKPAEMRKLVQHGTRILSGLRSSAWVDKSPSNREQLISVWKDLEEAWKGSDADVRTALTRLDDRFRAWTAADSDFAEIERVQVFRKKLHLALDH